MAQFTRTISLLTHSTPIDTPQDLVGSDLASSSSSVAGVFEKFQFGSLSEALLCQEKQSSVKLWLG